jgi:predicted adenylyl cyclase CyaB
MPANIEIKARVKNFKVLKRNIEDLYQINAEEISQVDTFFKIEDGRLKLRVFSNTKGELIYYLRNNSAGPKRSDYYIYKTDNPEELKKLLEMSLGIRRVVRKKRLLYLVGNTRIHLDKVENLGSFIELEVVLSPEQTEMEGKLITENFMKDLNIQENDFIDIAYIELLEK